MHRNFAKIVYFDMPKSCILISLLLFYRSVKTSKTQIIIDETQDLWKIQPNSIDLDEFSQKII